MSASDEIAALTAGELTANYKAGALTPLEATLAIFARIERLNPLYNAFALIDVKTPPIMTPPLNSPSALSSFERMKFWRGHFSSET